MSSPNYSIARAQQVTVDRAVRMEAARTARKRRDGDYGMLGDALGVILLIVLAAAVCLSFLVFRKKHEPVYHDPVCETCGEVLDGKHGVCKGYED